MKKILLSSIYITFFLMSLGQYQYKTYYPDNEVSIHDSQPSRVLIDEEGIHLIDYLSNRITTIHLDEFEEIKENTNQPNSTFGNASTIFQKLFFEIDSTEYVVYKIVTYCCSEYPCQRSHLPNTDVVYYSEDFADFIKIQRSIYDNITLLESIEEVPLPRKLIQAVMENEHIRIDNKALTKYLNSPS